MRVLLFDITRKLLLLFIITIPSLVYAQQMDCPPADQSRLKLMDNKIQEYLLDTEKFNILVSKISSENTSELITIITRIKSKIDPSKTISTFKSITTDADWTRLKEIMCPYLLVEPKPGETTYEPVIVFNGLNYKNGSEIIVDYNNESSIYEFEMKNYPQNDLYKGWQLYGIDNVDLSITNIVGFPDGAHGTKCKMDLGPRYDYKIVAQYGSSTQTVSVKFIRKRKEHNIKTIWAIDANNESRKAKEDEILYLIRRENNPSRQINYLIDTDTPNNEFWINEPDWTTTAFNKNITNDKQDYSANISKSSDKRKATHFLSKWSSVSTTTVKVFDNERSVSISLLTEDRKKTKATLPAKVDEAINKVFTSFNELTKSLNKITGGLIAEASVQQDVSMEQFNSEIGDSRHYYKNRTLLLGVNGTISAGELPIPVLSFSIPNIASVGAYIKPGVQLRIDGGATERQRSETDKWEYYSFNLNGKITGSLEAGLQVKFLPTVDAVKFAVRGYAKSSVFGVVSYRRLQDEDQSNELIASIGTDPLILGVNATVEMRTVLINMKVLDYSDEWTILDRVVFKSDPIRF